MKSRTIQSGAKTAPLAVNESVGFERGVLKGVCPLHGVTGALRRREGRRVSRRWGCSKGMFPLRGVTGPVVRAVLGAAPLGKQDTKSALRGLAPWRERDGRATSNCPPSPPFTQRATCYCQSMFPVVVCGRERVTRSGRSLSRPCRQRRGGGLSTLRSVRAAAIGDATVVRLRHWCATCRRDPVARMMLTYPSSFPA